MSIETDQIVGPLPAALTFRTALMVEFTGPDGAIYANSRAIGPDGEDAARTALTHWAQLAYGAARRSFVQEHGGSAMAGAVQ